MKMRKLTLIGAVVVCCILIGAAAVWAQGNGTVMVGGKVWLKDAGCVGLYHWAEAKNAVAGLASGRCGLTDNSKAGDWRLPTKDELLNVFSSKSLFTNVQTNYYWTETMSGTSSTPIGCHVTSGTCLPLGSGVLDYVWPVRR